MSEPGRSASLRSTQEALRAVLDTVESRPDELAAILDASAEALVAFSVDRKVLHANAGAEALFGYARGQLASLSTDELVPPRLRQPNPPPMTVTDDLVQVDLPGLMRDGSERPIEWCFGAARRSELPLFVMTVRDRRELDLALEALRASEERFDLLVNGVRDCAIFLLDETGRVSSWNTGASQIKGWATNEIIGRPYEVFFPEEDRRLGTPAHHLAATLEEGTHETTGWRVRKDGTRFWAHASLTLLRSPSGQVRGFAKITRDLTERQRAEDNERRLIAERAAREAAQEAERRIRESEAKLGRLQRITAALSEALTPQDVGGVVLGECLGAVGADVGAVYLLAPGGAELELVDHRGYPPGVIDPYRRAPLQPGTPFVDAALTRTPVFFASSDEILLQYPAMRGKADAVSQGAAALLPLLSHGELLGVISIRFATSHAFEPADRALLLTMSELCSQALDRARLFVAERAARAAAESANRSKDEFLAMLGHELRNPLAPIASAVQLMKVQGSGGEGRERDVIERQVAHIGRLVDDLLDVSRIARGLIDLTRTTVALRGVLEKSIEMASPLLEQKRQRLDVDLGAEPLHVDGDAMRLAQVVSNVLTNAAKYTPAGGRVWLSLAREGSDAVVRVRDDGEGIGADLLPVMFDRFVQGERTIERSQGGLGLGLALVKSLVTLHGGTVTATSAGIGQGSEFVVRLPAVAAPASVPAPPAETAARSPRATSGGKRILVVDDNEDAGDMLAHMLRTMGHEVQVAHDGPSALRELEGFAADVAILDIGLPLMDGFELARRVRARTASPCPRLIALTGYGQDRDVANSRSAGFDVHLVKPVDMKKLVAAVDG